MFFVNGIPIRPQRPCKDITSEVKIGPPPWDRVKEEPTGAIAEESSKKEE